MAERIYSGAATNARTYTRALHKELVKRLNPERFGEFVDNLIGAANSGNTKAAELVLKLSGVMDFDPDGLRSHLDTVSKSPFVYGLNNEETDEILDELYPPKTGNKPKGSRRI